MVGGKAEASGGIKAPGRLKVLETVVVEGRDDESAVLAALDANVICTHGYGIRPETLEVIATAYGTAGIVIFTDPDHAGSKIRERLTALYPGAKQAFLTKAQAFKDGDIGIENARPDDIIKALKASGCTVFDRASCFEAAYSGCCEGSDGPDGPAGKTELLNLSDPITKDDLVAWGLCGFPDSAALRDRLGEVLGIGSANGKTFAKRLNYLGISRERTEAALLKILRKTDDK